MALLNSFQMARVRLGTWVTQAKIDLRDKKSSFLKPQGLEP